MKQLLVLIAVISFRGAGAQDTMNYSRTEIIYGRKDGLAMTLFKLQPKANANGKAVISLVSGNWISTYRNVQGFERLAATFINSGYTVFLVMHGSQPKYSIQDETGDIRRAVRFIRFNAKVYQIDADHIGITGSSSGGHLALMTALADDVISKTASDSIDRISSRVQAAAVFFPPTDFLNWGKANTGVDMVALRKFGVASAFDFKTLSDSTGMYEHVKNDEEVKKIAMALSPINNVSSDDPPVYISHGNADPVVPLQQSQSLIEKLKAAGVKCELVIHPDGGHGWKNSEVEVKEFVKWFDLYLK